MEWPVTLPPAFSQLAIRLGVKPQDIHEQFVRGSGHGGQKMNKTSSTVLLVHLPTGTTVRVQRHREQSKNRLSAYKLLLLKLEEQIRGKQSKRQQEIFKKRKQKQRRNRKSKEKMLRAKHKRSELKVQRKPVID
ncbi:peptide chain release factor-like protein [Candidatus Peregrinibacteria bacterium]|nr:peptide chain release factor-like protein [Candidatus Peregrinibacteria bacterium]